ncbi:unnamed protein product [Closterium sp. NIES-64]|nr:unnamed protein product [Closterium sp. NIES-64]
MVMGWGLGLGKGGAVRWTTLGIIDCVIVTHLCAPPFPLPPCPFPCFYDLLPPSVLPIITATFIPPAASPTPLTLSFGLARSPSLPCTQSSSKVTFEIVQKGLPWGAQPPGPRPADAGGLSARGGGAEVLLQALPFLPPTLSCSLHLFTTPHSPVPHQGAGPSDAGGLSARGGGAQGRGRGGLFSSADITAAVGRAIPVDIHQSIQVNEHITITPYLCRPSYAVPLLPCDTAHNFHPPAHRPALPGTRCWEQQCSTCKRAMGASVLYTDLPTPRPSASPGDSREADFLSRVHTCVAARGKVLIPVLPWGEPQELCVLLDEYWHRMGLDVPIYLSAGLTSQATVFYKTLLTWTNQHIQSAHANRNIFDFRHVRPFDRALLDAPAPMVLFATPGMLSGGLSLQAFKAWAPHPCNLLVLPGFCMAGTVGGKIMAMASANAFLSSLLLPASPLLPPRFCMAGTVGGKIMAMASANAAAAGACALILPHTDAKGITDLIRHLAPRHVILSLLESSRKFYEAKHSLAQHGVRVDGVSVDLAAMMALKADAIESLTSGVERMFEQHRVNYVKGAGRITGTHEVTTFGRCPGSRSTRKKIVSSTGAMCLEKVPEKMLVVGGGVIGLEMGSVWSRLGADVTILEFADGIGGYMDNEIRQAYHRILESQGLKFLLGTKVVRGDASGEGVVLQVAPAKGEGETREVHADVVMVAAGRVPCTNGLGLDEVGVKRDMNGRIFVDSHFRSTRPTVYAIGDVIPGPMLAHKAEEDAIACVENIMNGHGQVNYATVPGIIYTHPEVAMLAGRGAMGEVEGFVKILADKETDLVLGAHILGPSAGELIMECVLAMEHGATTLDLARTCHAHPTLTEAVKEAALAAHGKPIHSDEKGLEVGAAGRVGWGDRKSGVGGVRVGRSGLEVTRACIGAGVDNRPDRCLTWVMLQHPLARS